MKSAKYILVILLFLIYGCKDSATTEVELYPLAEENKIDSEKLEAALLKAEESRSITSICVARNGVLIAEKYQNLVEENDLNHVWSVTKNFVSLAVGIAIEKGYIKSVDEKIGKYFDEYLSESDSLKRNISIKNLLMMSTGLTPDEFKDINSTDYVKWINSSDPVGYYLGKDFADEPGKTFRYFSGAPHLLSAIITKTTGKRLEEFLKENLFDKLSIDNYSWSFLENHLNPGEGYNNGGAGLFLTARDMIKFGELFLNRGVYEGNQIVTEEWIDLSTSYKIRSNDTNGYGPEYGYLWWIGDYGKYDYYFASGWAGQIILIVPELNLVVTATNSWQNIQGLVASNQWQDTMNLIMNDILRAVNP